MDPTISQKKRPFVTFMSSNIEKQLRIEDMQLFYRDSLSQVKS